MVRQNTVAVRLAEFAAGLQVAQCPPRVLDKAKAALLHGLVIGLASLGDADVQLARAMIADEGSGNATRLLGVGAPASRADAAFFASLLIHARGQDDSYRMLTHPGATIIPAALAEGDGRPVDGEQLLGALIAGYEVQCRLARDIVPAVQNHGFRASALFGIVGATVAAARIRGLSADQTAHALALAVSVAGGCLETSRAGTREMTFQEPIFCTSALQAVRLAEAGVTGADTCFEGPAGFFYAFTGSSTGELSGSFHGETTWDPRSTVADLGRRWEILDVTMKIYSAAGFNQPVIEAVAELAREHDLAPADVASLTIQMNQWETIYPSPRFPHPAAGLADFGSTTYFAAQALIAKGYPSTGRRLSYGGAEPATDEPATLVDLMARTKVVAGPRRQYAPRITIETTAGGSIVREMTGDEFKWDLATERERLAALQAALPLSSAEAGSLVAAVSNLESLPKVADLIDLTVPGAPPSP
ncbi:MAG: MmgE/PrpD family protein [Dehalococcoidia bacterium]